METNGLHQWFKRNLWGFIIVIGGFLITFATIQGQVKANTRDISDIRDIVERVIRLEEQEDNMEEDIKEIKQSIKEINRKID